MRLIGLLGSLLLGALVMSGCADETAILLEIDSPNLLIPTDIDELRIRAEGLESGRTTDRLFTPGSWPETLSIVPGEGSSSESVRITVFGRQGGVERLKRVVVAAFEEGATVDVVVVLERICLNVECEGADNYCLGGECVSVTPPGDMGVRDMGVPPDVGPSDLGTDDLGDPRDMDEPDMPDPLDMGPPDMPDVPVEYDGLIISEYVEGNSNNKAIEIYNGTGGSLNISACQLVLYRNGGAEADTFVAARTLAADETHVFCHAALATMPFCDSNESTSLNHNGNDAYALRCEGTIIDSIGANTGDPGSGWTGGGLSTENRTLRRFCPPTPDADLSDAFDPSTNWTGQPVDTFDGLGVRDCPSNP